MKTVEKTRFDTRISKAQKDFFEYAANIGGYRSLTDFVITSAQEKAKNIINQHNKILESNQDKKIFFDAVMSPSKPSESLLNAANDYKKALQF